MEAVDPVVLFERATARAAVVMGGVSSAQLGGPTPCAEWNVQQLIDHMVGGTDYLLAALDGVSPQPRSNTTADDYPAGVARVLEGLAGRAASDRTCMSPLGFEWPVAQATAGTFMDALIHTWDLATATGQDPSLDLELVAACSAMFLPDMPERAGRAAGSWDRPSRCPPDASPQDRLLGGDGPAAMTSEPSDEALRAIAHPGRRTMLRLVWDEERPATELADGAGMSKSAASQHLKLLRDAGLVTVRVDANRRLYRADLQRVAEIASFLDQFWAAPLERLRATAESTDRESSTARRVKRDAS